MNSDRPIGIFDSGVGGLTVVSHIQKKLPNENLIYFGDTARVPYGTKAPETIKKFSLEIVKFLVEKNVKCVVIACNSASAHAIHIIRKHYPDLPVYGMIESGAEYAVLKYQHKKIAVIGTSATIKSRAYTVHIQRLNEKVEITAIPCPLFVPYVEEGLFDHDLMDNVIDFYLKDLKKNPVDSMILGCTHYPFLKDKINDYFSKKIKLIDSGEAAASYLEDHLKEYQMAKENRKPFYHCFLTSATNKFFTISENCLKTPFSEINYVDIDH